MVSRGEKKLRHNYSPFVEIDDENRIWVLWLRFDGEKENICLKKFENTTWSEEIKINREKVMIYSPCIVSLPKNGVWVFWGEKKEKFWKLCGKNYDAEGNLKNTWEYTDETRLYNLRSHRDRRGVIYLVWESHSPGKTVIKMLKIKGNNFSSPQVISNPLFNSYDPSLASDSQGNLWIVYSSFRKGNYDIYSRFYSSGGELSREEKVNWIDAYSYYPTVAVDSQDRVWFSFVSYPGGYRLKEQFPLVKTGLRRKEHSFWLAHRYIYCVCLDRGKWYVPIKKDAPQPSRCTGVVPLPENAIYPRVVFDRYGKLWIFYRCFHFNEKTCAWRSQINAVYHRGEGWSSSVKECKEEFLGDAEPISLVEDREGKFWYVWQADHRRFPEYFEKENGEEIYLGYLDPKDMEGTSPELYPLTRGYTPVIFSSSEIERDLTVGGKRFRLVFGNIHRHSQISGCDRPYNGSFDLHYRHARDVMGESFSALTDHGTSGDDLNWYRNLKAVALYHFPRFFVVLPSVEWTASERKGVEKLGESLGHYNIHYFGEEREAVPYTARDFGYSDTPDRVWKLLGNKKALTIVHHPADWDHHHAWDYYNPQFEPVVEIFQDLRGSAEFRGCPGTTGWRQTPREGCFVQDALKKGFKLGFIGGGDHFGVAMAGVYVENLTRQGLFEAFKRRRCFATTGIKFFLDFRLNEAFMGEVLKRKAVKRRIIYVHVKGPVKIYSITIVRNNKDIYTLSGRNEEESFEYHDEEPWEKLIRPREYGNPSIYYYLRIIFENGEMGWSSPIWLEENC